MTRPTHIIHPSDFAVTPDGEQYRMVPAGRWPLWLAPGLWGAALGACITGLVWGVSAWL